MLHFPPVTSSASDKIQMPPVGICKTVEEHCLMVPHKQCNADLFSMRKVNWAMREECQSWYHCSCIGISKPFFDRYTEGADFTCCRSPTDNKLYVYL